MDVAEDADAFADMAASSAAAEATAALSFGLRPMSIGFEKAESPSSDLDPRAEEEGEAPPTPPEPATRLTGNNPSLLLPAMALGACEESNLAIEAVRRLATYE
jgi:hypothetical protein